LQHIANNTLDVFTDYKCVTKSYNPVRNVPERVEVPNKTTQLPCKRGRSTTISMNAAPSKQRKRKNKSSNSTNATQPQVEEHPVDIQPSHPTSTVHSITDVGTSKCPDATILGDEDASQRVGMKTIDRRPNHFHFHIFFLQIEIDTILSETNTTLIFR
jgi:hypothetical protein